MTRSRDVASNGGLVLITSQSFTSSAGISINNCFSSTYDNYRLVWNVSGGTNVSHRMRFRASGTDATSSIYYQAGFYVADNGSTGSVFSGNTTFLDLNYSDPSLSSFTGDINAPYISGATHVSGLVTYGVSGVVVTRSTFTSARVTGTGVYDGVTLYPSSGTMTGTVQIYGYKK